jgi:hypothetical protein
MRRHCLAPLIALLLAACGGIEAPSALAPKVVQTHPAAGATDVLVDTTVWARFDAAVAQAWLTGSFELSDGSGVPVAVALAYDAETFTATFTPDAPLSHGTQYEASFRSGVTTSSLRVLTEDVQWAFTTAAGEEPGDGDDDGEPGDGNDEPGDGNDDGEPGDGNDEPGDGNDEPGDGNDEPGDGNDEPGDGNDEPGDGNDEPGDGNDEPGDGNDEPGDGNGEPGDGETNEQQVLCEAAQGDFEDGICTLTGPRNGLKVPAGVTWILDDVTVNGNMEIGAGAVVTATNLVITGFTANLEVIGAESVQILGTSIGGNAAFEHCVSVELQGVRIDGNASFEDIQHLTLIDNAFWGTLTLEGNAEVVRSGNTRMGVPID